MIDKHKVETYQWNILVKGVYLCETPYCSTASTPWIKTAILKRDRKVYYKTTTKRGKR